MMMIAPIFLASQKEGVQGGEEEAGYQIKVGQTGTPTSGLSHTGRLLDAKNRRKHGLWYGVHRHTKDSVC